MHFDSPIIIMKYTFILLYQILIILDHIMSSFLFQLQNHIYFDSPINQVKEEIFASIGNGRSSQVHYGIQNSITVLCTVYTAYFSH